jgi:N-acetylglutamate synthase-like GNAT family acetyltransferase
MPKARAPVEPRGREVGRYGGGMETHGMEIRLAKVEDAEAALDLVRRSIVELCREDHHGDRLTLEGWLANKSLKNMTAWINMFDCTVVVAEKAGRLAGVGAFMGAGEVILLYVAPEDRFTGVSKVLLADIEDRARKMRLPMLRLTSSITAQRFFLERGYEKEEDEGDLFEPGEGSDMKKRLD